MQIHAGGYTVTVARGSLDDVGRTTMAVAPAHRVAVISDESVAPLYAARVAASFAAAGLPADAVRTFTLPAGEHHKTREQWARLTDALLDAGYGRDSTVVALGGGVVGDLAGFVAATFMRGIPFVQLPTTLLAMVDASIGGKTGVDTPAGKNLVGAFYPPAAVVVDPECLATLPAPQLRAGLAEVIKHGVIADAGYFERVVAALPDVADSAMAPLIARSIEIKAAVVRQDEREGGIRKTLNFGHTLGHAIESVSGYRLLHGEAVAIGMVLESALAERLGVAERGTAERVRHAVTRAELPAVRPASLIAEHILAATRSDKKARRGRVEYALPARIGAMAAAGEGWSVPVDDALVLEVLERSR